MILPTDIHTHHPECHKKAIVSTTPYAFEPQASRCYSLGIHPWETDSIQENDLSKLAEMLRHKQVVAVGETGIDRLRGGTIEQQTALFKAQATLSESLRLPLIIHAVRSFDIILSIRKQLQPQQKWIIHGFRNNAATAMQLLQAGCDLSFGEHFQPEALRATPINRLWIESDDSLLTETDLYSQIALCRHCSTTELRQSITERMLKVFFTKQ